MSTLQYNPLRYPVYVTAKPVGAACNLRCDYCYFLEKKEAGQPARMSDELLLNYTEQYVHAQPGQDVLFTWHGGEPLLLGLDYYRKALRYQKPYRREYRIDNVLQTNGTLLDDDWCRFFKENNFLIGLSLDGPQHCHDHYRLDASQNGSFTQVMRGLELLQKHGVEYNILSVVNDYNARFPLEVYRFFKSIGAQYIQFSPVVERIDTGTGKLHSQTLPGSLFEENEEHPPVTPWSVSPIAYGSFLNAIFDEWLRHDVGSTFVTTFDATLAGYLGVSPGSCIWGETCGHAAALQLNGDLFSCDHFVFPAYRLGNIRRQTITELMLSPRQIEFGAAKRDTLPGVCRQCTFLQLCHGECPKNRFLTLPDEPYPLNYLCSGLKSYFAHTRPIFLKMAELLRQGKPASDVRFCIKRG